MKKLISVICSAVFALLVMLVPMSAKAGEIAPKAGYVATKYTGLIVRSSASADSEVLTSLKKGSYVTLISKSGGWWKVQYGKGKYGYCNADYIGQLDGENASVVTTYGRLNVREGEGTDFRIVGALTKGTEVIELSRNNGWSKILYDGSKVGFVSTKYLSFGKGAIKLNVPSFKQRDSRWANVKIGSSGKTIAQIGCVTTAIAMIESYETGTTIYPDAMSKKLKYTASGSVYWPSDYATITSSSNYLSAIYELLKQGKPVLFGSKDKYGGQHWVVITGYNGGDNLTASGFTINDPGSNTKTTLAQHLSSHPTFYKYMYHR